MCVAGNVAGNKCHHEPEKGEDCQDHAESAPEDIVCVTHGLALYGTKKLVSIHQTPSKWRW